MNSVQNLNKEGGEALMSDLTITDSQLAAVIKIKTDAQDEFFRIVDGRIIETLAPVDRAEAMYQKGKAKAIDFALYLMDIRSR